MFSVCAVWGLLVLVTGKLKRDVHIIPVQSTLPFPFRQIFPHKARTFSIASPRVPQELEMGGASFFAILVVCKMLFSATWRSLTHLWLEPSVPLNYLKAYAPRDLLWTTVLIEAQGGPHTQVNPVLTFIVRVPKGSSCTS
jgi:hypothetical protein